MIDLTNRGTFCPECEEEAHPLLIRSGEISKDNLECSECGLIFKEENNNES